ncbi:MAG: CopG family transcriptional regulator [Gammaproteobacteria bacterium]
MTRARVNVFVEREHARRLEELATMRGLSKSSLVAHALAHFLSPEGGGQREAAIAKRLDRLTHQVEGLERDQQIGIETLALFVRYTMAVTPPVTAEQQDAARAQGTARFAKFVEQLGRHLQRGGSLVKAVHAEIRPEDAEFFAPDSSPPEDVP